MFKETVGRWFVRRMSEGESVSSFNCGDKYRTWLEMMTSQSHILVWLTTGLGLRISTIPIYSTDSGENDSSIHKESNTTLQSRYAD